MRRTAAVAMAHWAREAVPLYRELYRGLPPVESWRDFRRLPVLTAARLHATPLAEQLDNPDDALRTFTPFQLRSVATPAAIVADRDDIDAAFDEVRAAFALAGVGRGTRLALLAAPEQRYVAAEMAERLGYFGVRAHVLVRLDEGRLVRQCVALAPDHIAGIGGAEPHAVRLSITVRRPDSDAADLYLAPGAGIVAVRPRGAVAYVPLTQHYLVERGRDGHLLLTALRRYHQPLIRHELPDRGRIAGGRLLLDEVAP